MMPTKKRSPQRQAPTLAEIRRATARAEAELAYEQVAYTTRLLKQFNAEGLSEANAPVRDDDLKSGMVMVASGSQLTLDKDIAELRQPWQSRRESYRAWRTKPHARGILRTFQKFVIGRGFRFDPADQATGVWNDDASAVIETNTPEDPKLVNLIWDDFVERDRFNSKDKEIVLRTFRDGECFIRRFKSAENRTAIRFVEPEHVASSETIGKVETTVSGTTKDEPTVIRHGVESLARDPETVVAYHIKTPDRPTPERVPASEILHLKCLADTNDARGIPLLEVILPTLTDYHRWLRYRIVLNEVRTSIALVRKIEGTAAQASAVVTARGSGRDHPEGHEPMTDAGRRETMFRPGTMLTASPGISYEFITPNINARDASEDGRRILMAAAAASGLPEMLVTGDWSNANYASSVEGRTPATREWEDWQDFFEPFFRRIWHWVLDDAIANLGLPKTTDRTVTIQWPPVIQKDMPKETDRRAVLNVSGILSKKTWAALEDLDWDEEQENFNEERAESDETAMMPPGTGGAEEPMSGDDDAGMSESRTRLASAVFLSFATLQEDAAKLSLPPAERTALDQLLGQGATLLTGLLEVGGRRSTGGMRVQSLIFDKATYPDVSAARRWATAHGFAASKVDTTGTSFRLRQIQPGRFKKQSFKTIKLTDGVSAVVARIGKRSAA